MCVLVYFLFFSMFPLLLLLQGPRKDTKFSLSFAQIREHFVRFLLCLRDNDYNNNRILPFPPTECCQKSYCLSSILKFSYCLVIKMLMRCHLFFVWCSRWYGSVLCNRSWLNDLRCRRRLYQIQLWEAD